MNFRILLLFSIISLSLGNYFISDSFAVDFVDSIMSSAYAVNSERIVKIPQGTSMPGCEETKDCFIPFSITVQIGDRITWLNEDTAAHTVTSGSPYDGPSGIFDSSLIIVGSSYEWTPTTSGEVPYYCMVHPWMTGKVTVSTSSVPT